VLPVATSRPPHAMMRCGSTSSSNLSLDGHLRHLTLTRGTIPRTSDAGRESIHPRTVQSRTTPPCGTHLLMVCPLSAVSVRRLA
jgi:hypothetical protein